VACGFIYYISNWGGRWWGGGFGMFPAVFISAVIGIFVGGFAGWTCDLGLGTLLGARLSGFSCLFFTLPIGFMILMSHPGGLDRIETLEILIDLVAMIIAGAVAGCAGALIGRRARPFRQ
jgi:hypothetical protein